MSLAAALRSPSFGLLLPAARLATLLAVVGALVGAPTAGAHDLTITEAVMVVHSSGQVQIEMVCDLDALALGASPTVEDALLSDALSALDDADLEVRRDGLRRLFERRVKLRADGQILPLHVSFPDQGRAASPDEPPTYFGLSARLSARLPEAAEAITFMASRAFPPVDLTILDQRSLGGRRELLVQGQASTPYLLADAAVDDGQSRPPGVARRYLALGFTHIIPRGTDHVLFVLGLLLFGLRWRPLLLQVSAFTAAHTVTLGLAALGALSLDPGIVEPLIALSIAWVAIENILRRGEGALASRTAVVFGFGLLHGLGFAGVLGELGLPAGAFIPALLAFNVGVELGQLSVIALAFAVIGWVRDRPWFEPWIARPASALIAAAGLWWFVDRLIA